MRLVAGHAFWLDGPIDGLVRAPLPRLARDRPRARARRPQARRPRTRSTSRRGSSSTWRPSLGAVEEERHSPHRLADLAVDGNDLIEIGYREGPALGGELARLLDLVVDDPDLNERDTLLEERTALSFPERRVRARALPPHPRGGGPDVTVVAATKYVPLAELGVLAEAGVEVVGENRAQDLAAQARRLRRRVPLALHRPPAVEQGQGRERDLRARPLARLRVGRAAAHRPGAARGQPLRRGVEGRAWRPRRSRRGSSGYPDVRGLMTMPPLADDPEASRPWFRRLRELGGASTGWPSSPWGRRRTGASRSRRGRR